VISRFSAAAEIRMVAPLTRSPFSESSSSSWATRAAAVQADGKPGLFGNAGVENGRPTGDDGGGGVAVPFAGVGAEGGAGAVGGAGVGGACAGVPDEFCVYQAGGA
jgi:hypothetical protein